MPFWKCKAHFLKSFSSKNNLPPPAKGFAPIVAFDGKQGLILKNMADFNFTLPAWTTPQLNIIVKDEDAHKIVATSKKVFGKDFETKYMHSSQECAEMTLFAHTNFEQKWVFHVQISDPHTGEIYITAHKIGAKYKQRYENTEMGEWWKSPNYVYPLRSAIERLAKQILFDNYRDFLQK